MNQKFNTIFVMNKIGNMEIIFEKEYLQELYDVGITTDKRHRFQPEIARKYRYCIELMLAVPDIKSLFKLLVSNKKSDIPCKY